MSSPVEITFKPSGAETTATSGATIEVPYTGPLAIIVNVTASSGTSPTFTVRFQGRIDGTQNWGTIQTAGGTSAGVGTISGAARATTLILPGSFRQMRYRSSFGGTSPSFTYSVRALNQP